MQKKSSHSYLFAVILGILVLGYCCTSLMDSHKPSSSAFDPFKAEYDSTLTESKIVIKNSSEKTITLRLEGDETQSLAIPPYKTKSITIASGTYNYFASAIGVQPASGTKNFKKKFRYTWEFIIVRRD